MCLNLDRPKELPLLRYRDQIALSLEGCMPDTQKGFKVKSVGEMQTVLFLPCEGKQARPWSTTYTLCRNVITKQRTSIDQASRYTTLGFCLTQRSRWK